MLGVEELSRVVMKMTSQNRKAPLQAVQVRSWILSI
jgi:hypothetical protein